MNKSQLNVVKQQEQQTVLINGRTYERLSNICSFTLFTSQTNLAGIRTQHQCASGLPSLYDSYCTFAYHFHLSTAAVPQCFFCIGPEQQVLIICFCKEYFFMYFEPISHVGLNFLTFFFLFSYFLHMLHESITLLCLKGFSCLIINCLSHFLTVFLKVVYSMANHRLSNIVQIIQILCQRSETAMGIRKRNAAALLLWRLLL